MQLSSIYLIHEKAITFKKYCFWFSSLHKQPLVGPDRINAVSFKTIPHSLIIDGREIIFMNHGDEALRSFAARHNIPETDHPDTWSMLTTTFLDTEYGDEVLEREGRMLAALGFSDDMLRKIRRRVSLTFFGTWEFAYLGLWQLLAAKRDRSPLYPLLGRKFYWWAMRIALKGSAFEEKAS